MYLAPTKCVLTEWIDPKGIAQARQDLKSLLLAHPHQSKRIAYLRNYLRAIDGTYEKARLDGPNGCLARPLDCVYTCIRGGRMYCTTHEFVSTEQPRFICAQSMPSVLRPYLMRRWVHDLDIANCHITLVFQLAQFYHLWPEHEGRVVQPLHLRTLQALHERRAEFIERIAADHHLDDDAARYPGYRKDTIKPLLLRVMYGGSYDVWMQENGLYGVKCALVIALHKEMECVRRAMVASKRFAPLVAIERTVQEKRRRSLAAAERGIFAKIAQHVECAVLMSMCNYLKLHGWRVHSLIYDGLTVEHRTDAAIDTRDIEKHVAFETQFTVSIVEKPLFSSTRPRPESLLK